MIFLDFLAQDIQNNPQNLRPITSDLVDRVRSLVSGIDFEMDESIEDEWTEDQATFRLSPSAVTEIGGSFSE